MDRDQGWGAVRGMCSHLHHYPIQSGPEKTVTPEMLIKATIRRRLPGDVAYSVADGGGRCVHVMPAGAKLWRMRYHFDGKEKMLSFGVHPPQASQGRVSGDKRRRRFSSMASVR